MCGESGDAKADAALTAENKGKLMPKAIVGVTAGAIFLAACTGGQAPSPGANSGIVEDSRVGAGAGEVPVGAIEGGLLGLDIGRSLSDADRQAALQAEYQALEYGRAGEPIAWRSQDSGVRGEVVVGPSYEVNRLDCREYTHTVYIDGRARVTRGTACRRPEGTWRMIG